MKLFLLLFFLCTLFRVSAQKITIDKVTLKNVEDTIFFAEIPKAIDLTGKNTEVVNRINSEILSLFGLLNFNPEQPIEFRWGNIDFSYKIKKNILYLKTTSESYEGAYPQHYEEELFFNLKTGKTLQLKTIPFDSLFTSSGYLEFMNKYWLDDITRKLDSATLCSGMKPLCTPYDISTYNLRDDNVSISYGGYCFPHVAQFCSPSHKVTIALNTIKPYLNDLGLTIFSAKNYFSEDPIKRIIAYQKLFEND